MVIMEDMMQIPIRCVLMTYENQLVEAEARAFAAQFKDKLASVNGGFHDERNY